MHETRAILLIGAAFFVVFTIFALSLYDRLISNLKDKYRLNDSFSRAEIEKHSN